MIEKHTKITKGQSHIDTNTEVSVVNTSLNAIVVEEQGTSQTTNEALSNSGTSSSQNVGNTSNNTNTVHDSSISTEQTTNMNTTTMLSSPSSLPKPKLQLPKFGGRVTDWNSFWDSYNSAIHGNPNISKVNKFNYLQSLLEGNAARAIKGLTLTAANYDNAINILHDQFGKVQQTIAAHMDEILKMQACTSGRSSQLRYVYDKISVHVRGLASLVISSEQYGSMLIPIIMSKLPSEIRLEIARNATTEIWKIDDLLNMVRMEIEAWEVSESVQSNPQQN